MNMDRRKTQAKTARLEIELKRLDRNPQQEIEKLFRAVYRGTKVFQNGRN